MNTNTNLDLQGQNSSLPERREAPVNQSQSGDLTTEENKKLKILEVKADPSFQKVWKETPPDKKEEFKNELQEMYGEEFGEPQMAKDERQKLKELQEKAARKIKLEIDHVRNELINTPPDYLFENIDDAKTKKRKEESGEPTFHYSSEEIRLMITRGLPEKLRALFEQFFVVKLDLSNWLAYTSATNRERNDQINKASGGALVEGFTDTKTGKDKFRILLDPTSCIELRSGILSSNEKLRMFSEDKLVYTITRAIIATIKGKKEFEEFCRKNGFGKNIDKNCRGNFDDWLTLTLLNKKFSDSTGKFSKVDSKLQEAANTWLERVTADQIMDPKELGGRPMVIQSRDIDEKLYAKKIPGWIDKSTGEYIRGWRLSLLETNQWLGKGVYAFTEAISRFRLFNKEYYYMHLADEDAKEIKKLLSRDLPTSDYMKLFADNRFSQNKDRLRQLIILLAQKSMYQWWMLQLWLWKFDPVFRRTKGKEVSSDGYDLVTRASKAYTKAVGPGPVVLPEYVEKAGRFIRVSYAKQLAKMDGILNTMSLRQIQRFGAEIYANVHHIDGKKFIDPGAKLGQDNGYGKEGVKKYYASCDIQLDELLGKKEADKFFKDMKNYANDLGEQDFNNLVNAGVLAVTRRYLRASRVEKELFSMYTAPSIKQGYEAYQDKVGETQFVKDDYETDFAPIKKELKKADFNFDALVNDSSLQDLNEIYNEFVKEKKYDPLIRTPQQTKYGRLLEFIKQSKTTILKDEILTDSIKDFITTQLEQFSHKKQIYSGDIEKFRLSLDEKIVKEKKLLSLSMDEKSINRLNKWDQATTQLIKNLNGLFKHLENLGIVKQFHLLFKPFETKLSEYQTRQTALNDKQKESIKSYFWKEIALEKTSIDDKVRDLKRQYSYLAFTDEEVNKVSAIQDHKERNVALYSLLEQKLSEASMPSSDKLSKDYDKLDQLYSEINQNFKDPNSETSDFEALKVRFLALNIIPESVKNKEINSTYVILNYLQLAKTVVNNHYLDLERSGFGRKTSGYSQTIEDELEEEETRRAQIEEEE